MVGTPNQGASLLPMIMFAIAFAVGLTILKRRNTWNGADTIESALKQVRIRLHEFARTRARSLWAFTWACAQRLEDAHACTCVL